MSDEGTPIAYTALERGTPVLSRSGRRVGTVEHVLQVPEEDLFDGLVIATDAGLRFVDRDQIETITTAALPKPDGAPVYSVDALQSSGRSLHDVLGRLFGRPHWTREK